MLSLAHNNAQVLERRSKVDGPVAPGQTPGRDQRPGTDPATSVHPQETSLPDESLCPTRPKPDTKSTDDARLEPLSTSDLSFRHRGWLPLRRKVAAAIASEWPYSRRYERFLSCGQHAYVVKHPTNASDYRVQADYCHDRWCVPCARQRARVLASNLSKATADRPCRFVTLTLKSGQEPLHALVHKLYRCFALLRRTRLWRAKVTGGAAIVEVVRGKDKNRWHPHLHVLVHGGFIPQRELSAEWLRITRDSSIVDIRLARTESDVAHYVTKYVSKPIPAGIAHNPDLLLELITALHKKRLCATFGTWRGLRLTDTGDPVEWMFVGSLATIRRDAAHGVSSAVAILNVLSFSAKWIDDPPEDPRVWDQ